MKNRKTWFNFLFLLLCLALTVSYLFRGEDPYTLLSYIGKASPAWWIPGIALVLLFIMSESVAMSSMLKSLGAGTHLTRCFLYSFTGFFFCLVTPGASGGQPVQLLMMKKDGIPVHMSTIVLLVITIAYKLVLIIFSLIVLIVRPAGIMALIEPAMGWIRLGLFLTLLSTGGMLMLVFRPGIVKKCALRVFSLIKRMSRSKKIHKAEEKLRESLEKYGEVSLYIKSNMKIFMRVTVLTAIQRNFLFSVTFLVLLSFGITGLGFFETITLQAMISTAVDMLPVPGGMGMSEHLYRMIFTPVCGDALTLPSLLIVRGLTYYTQLLVCAVMTLVAWLKIFGTKKIGDAEA